MYIIENIILWKVKRKHGFLQSNVQYKHNRQQSKLCLISQIPDLENVKSSDSFEFQILEIAFKCQRIYYVLESANTWIYSSFFF